MDNIMSYFANFPLKPGFPAEKVVHENVSHLYGIPYIESRL